MKGGKVGPCGICEAPTAKSYHFGVKSCKACAAFFRRTIALKVKYQCKQGLQCVIHHEKRYLCKQCRLNKCYRLGMIEELVESKGKASERKRLLTPQPEIPDCFPELPSCSKDSKLHDIVAHYVKIESLLVDRRRITFSNIRFKEIIYDKQDCPYNIADLKPFDYKTYEGCQKHEFAAVFDYVRVFPRYEELNHQDQDILFRLSCPVDLLMCMAYYTIKKGLEMKIIINTNSTYLPMDPWPMSGEEPDFNSYFSTPTEAQKYKTLVSPMAHYWNTLILPLNQLNPTFAEFSLLKALVCWHICYYKFHPDGQEICSSQRNAIMQALFKLAEDRELGSGVTRTGELLLYINAVFEHTYELLESLYMMRMFNIIRLDDFVSDLLNQHNVLTGRL